MMPTDKLADTKSASDDLHFIRTVIEESKAGHISANSGRVLFVAGTVYGIQTIYFWAQIKGWVPDGGLTGLLAGILPTAIFLGYLGHMYWQQRHNLIEKTTVTRAISATFSGAGIANLAMIIVFGVAAHRAGDFKIWLLYPAVVFALQGAVWYVIAMLKKSWRARGVAAGWYVSAAVLGLTNDAALYCLIASFALFAFMAVPGYYLMRQKN